jgi:hypothetical protein
MTVAKMVEDLLVSKFGSGAEYALLEYIKEKSYKNPQYLTEVNQALYSGIHQNYQEEREQRQEVEAVAISALSVVDKRKLNLKKNKLYKDKISEILPKFKCFNVSEFQKDFKEE